MGIFRKRVEDRHTNILIQSGHKNITAQPAYKNRSIITFEPRDYQEVRFVADNLKMGKASIVNLNRLPKEEVKRVTDFLSGVIYTIDGTVKKLDSKMYLFTPSAMNIGNL